jgi:hypothetical protein
MMTTPTQSGKIKELLQSTDESHHHFAFQLMSGMDYEVDEIIEVIYKNISLISLSEKYGLTKMLEAFEKCECLDLSNQKMQEIPPEITRFKNLKELDLSYSMIGYASISQETIETLSRLPFLEVLKITKCGGIPNNIDKLTQLKVLVANKNPFMMSIPQSITHLKHLEKVDLTECFINSALYADAYNPNEPEPPMYVVPFEVVQIALKMFHQVDFLFSVP